MDREARPPGVSRQGARRRARPRVWGGVAPAGRVALRRGALPPRTRPCTSTGRLGGGSRGLKVRADRRRPEVLRRAAHPDGTQEPRSGAPRSTETLIVTAPAPAATVTGLERPLYYVFTSGNRSENQKMNNNPTKIAGAPHQRSDQSIAPRATELGTTRDFPYDPHLMPALQLRRR